MCHEFHVLDKASKDKVMTGITSGITFYNYQSKAVMQALIIIDYPVEPHLFLMKVKKILTKRPSHACVEIQVNFVTANTVCGR